MYQVGCKIRTKHLILTRSRARGNIRMMLSTSSRGLSLLGSFYCSNRILFSPLLLSCFLITVLLGGIVGRGVPRCFLCWGVPRCFLCWGIPGCFLSRGVPRGFLGRGVPGCFLDRGVPGCFLGRGVPRAFFCCIYFCFLCGIFPLKSNF